MSWRDQTPAHRGELQPDAASPSEPGLVATGICAYSASDCNELVPAFCCQEQKRVRLALKLAAERPEMASEKTASSITFCRLVAAPSPPLNVM